MTVLRDDLLECRSEILPPEDLDVLLDVPRLGVAEGHDHLEELLAFGLSLADCEGVEPLQIPSDPVLLLDGESRWRDDELFQKVDGVNGCDEAFLLLGPVYAADADAVGRPLRQWHCSKGGLDMAALLRLLEHHDASSVVPLFLCPLLCHLVKIPVDLKGGLRGEDTIRVTVPPSADRWASGLGTQRTRPDELWSTVVL